MSLSPKIDEIRLYVQDHDPDIMCLTETWLKDTVESSVIHITIYTLVRKDRIYAQHGGVCLYIKESIPFTVLREYERDISIEVLWCKLCPRRLPRGFSYLVVGVVYHPPTADDEQMINYLINTLSEIESSMPNAAIILAGDFNRLNTAQITIQFHLKQLVSSQHEEKEH
jgi:exonuclease III